MSILARNRHQTGRGGKMLEETVVGYSFLRQCMEIIFASLAQRSLPQSDCGRLDDDPCSIEVLIIGATPERSSHPRRLPARKLSL